MDHFHPLDLELLLQQLLQVVQGNSVHNAVVSVPPSHLKTKKIFSNMSTLIHNIINKGGVFLSNAKSWEPLYL